MVWPVKLGRFYRSVDKCCIDPLRPPLFTLANRSQAFERLESERHGWPDHRPPAHPFERLAQGAMGDVWKVEYTKLARPNIGRVHETDEPTAVRSTLVVASRAAKLGYSRSPDRAPEEAGDRRIKTNSFGWDPGPVSSQDRIQALDVIRGVWGGGFPAQMYDALRRFGGEGGIRTLGRGLSPTTV